MVELTVSVSGNHIDKLRGDGFVVGYSNLINWLRTAAGGPIVTPEFSGIWFRYNCTIKLFGSCIPYLSFRCC